MVYDLEALVSRLTALESKHMDLLEAYGLLVNAYEELRGEKEAICKEHLESPHGFDRNASHNAGRYVCDCESWEPNEDRT